ncbi:MAG TPA: sigma-E factor regulatory protein RseB domain-containing protein [Planctomycetota bacterium]|nr:sigma-E factor regulatory protein RseB domain-containing protein [Planctomycetota bacterium]
MMSRRMVRNVLATAGIALLAAPAAFAVLAEASHGRDAAFLEEVRAAQDRVRFQGRKVVAFHDGTAILDVRADRPGRLHVETVQRPAGRRGFGWPGRGPRGRFADPALIAENYRLDPRGRETLAGREADRFALRPRRPGRAAYEFAVDRSTRFLLAFRAVAADGTTLYDSRFESIEFNPAARPEASAPKPSTPTGPKQERPRRVIRQRVTEEELRGAMPFTVWRPAWVPEGFRLRALERYVIRDLGEAVMGTWSDGMASIFVVQADASNPAWELFRGLYLGLPEAPAAAAGTDIVAHRMRHPGGAVLNLTLEGTELLIGGQIDPSELEEMAKRLVKID